MKLELTPQRLTANRNNAPLGGKAYAKKMAELYEANPTYCKKCSIVLPQNKKHNKFCSQSCAASFNNAKTPKRKAVPKPEIECALCCKKTIRKKYCSDECYQIGRLKYKTAEERTQAIRKRVREISANYRAKVRNQTPPDADRKAIQEFYANCPNGYEVDHIIPISKGGLHTLSNLQYLTITENRRKSNKL